jgi:hypothetical protein
MPRRKQPIDISETIFRQTPMIEHYRRTVRYLEAHHAHLTAAGATRRELATLMATIEQMRAIVSMGEIFPPDTPEPDPQAGEPWPLCPPGAEGTMEQIFEIALGDNP